MLPLKKLTLFICIITVIFILISSSSQSFADYSYPLENEEVIVDKTEIDENHVQLFTKLNDQFYIRKLVRNENQWIIEDSEIIHQKTTGLNFEEVTGKGDPDLAKALEKSSRAYGFAAASALPIVDYSASEYLPPVGDQLESNTCVGWVTGYYLRTYQQAKDLGWKVKELGKGIDAHIFSPSFIYNQINGGKGGGAFVEDAGKLLSTVGAATIDKFPFYPEDYLTLPDQEVLSSAYSHRIREWRTLYTKLDSDQDIIERIKAYLNTGDLVIAGGNIGFKFHLPYIGQNGEYIITTDNYITSSHAYLIVGYDDTFVTADGTGAFKIVNSWGEQWANKGFCYISYKAFVTNAISGFVFTDLINVGQQELPVSIDDLVSFNIDFSGTGTYDVKIIDTDNTLVYEEKQIQASQGKNTICWGGKDLAANIVQDGEYKLNIITYRGSEPLEPYVVPFHKQGKVQNASCKIIRQDGLIQFVEIPVSFKKDGLFTIKVSYNEQTYDVVTNEPVKTGEDKTYKITNDIFDFNLADLEKINIEIQVL